MTNDSSPQHSGSRWEPGAGTPSHHLTASAPDAAPSNSAAAPSSGPATTRRRLGRRGPVLAVLAAVLTLGAATAGLAYVRADAEPAASDPAAPLTRAADGAPGDGAQAEPRDGGLGGGDRPSWREHSDSDDDRADDADGRHGDGDHRADDHDDEDGQSS